MVGFPLSAICSGRPMDIYQPHFMSKATQTQLLVSCGGGRRPADWLRKQHVRTIGLLVWDTLEDFSPLGFHSVRGTQTARYTHVRGRRTNQYRMTDEHLSYGTSLNSRDDYNINMGLYGESCGVNDGQRTTWRPRKLTSVEKMYCPCQLKMNRDKMEEGHGCPLRTTGIARGPPSRGGVTCKVYVMSRASSR
jgi:hypothetical protein